MPRLKKSAATGHLLKNAAGHLVNLCEVPLTTTGTSVTGSTTTAPGGPQNGCNACDPPLPDRICVLLSGIEGANCACSGYGLTTTTQTGSPIGDMEVLNGAHVLEWEHDCTWAKRWTGPNGEQHAIILWDSRSGGDFHHWVIWAQTRCEAGAGVWRGCRLIFAMPPWPDPECDPTGDYAGWYCTSTSGWCTGPGCVCTETTDASCFVEWCSSTTTPAS